jgi:hypothetical protein
MSNVEKIADSAMFDGRAGVDRAMFPPELTRGSRLLQRVAQLAPGKRIRITRQEWQDASFPPDLDPLGPRLRGDERVEWFLHRLPFPCTCRVDPLDDNLFFHRVPV